MIVFRSFWFKFYFSLLLSRKHPCKDFILDLLVIAMPNCFFWAISFMTVSLDDKTFSRKTWSNVYVLFVESYTIVNNVIPLDKEGIIQMMVKIISAKEK